MKKLLSILACLALVLTLASCVAGNAAAAQKKLEKKGYTVDVTTEVVNVAIKAANLLRDTDKQLPFCEEAISASKKNEDGSYESVSAAWFKSAKDAKAYYEWLDSPKNYTLKGKVVYSGSEQGIKDFA